MRLNHYACTILLVGSLMPAWAQHSKKSAADKASASPTSAAPLIIDGKPVTAEQLSSFSLMLEQSEGRPIEDHTALMDEYVLTQLHSDLVTTVPDESKGAKSPYKYASMGQRQVLKAALQKQVQQNVKVPRSEMEEWYKNNSTKYITPARVRAYHLFMETSNDEPSSSPAKVRPRMEKVKAEADGGTSFGLLAEKYSEASSGKSGGEIGYITPGMPIGPQNKPMNIALENALFGLEPGKVSDIVQTSHGLHLLYISDKSSTITPTLDNLVTSGVLPGAVSNEHITSDIKKLIAETVTKHGGKVSDTSSTRDQLTTQTPAFTFDGKSFTISDMENLYGARFTRFYQRAQGNADQLKDLLKQGMEDEAMVQSAVDAGLAKLPENKDQIELLGKRAAAVKHIQRIIAETYPVPIEKAKELYEQQKDQMRQPEAEGSVLIAKAKESNSPADAGRYRDLAMKQAQAARDLLTSDSDFESVAAKVATKDVETTFGKIQKHVLGQATDPLGRSFDQATAGAKEGGFSEVVPAGNDYAVAKLEKRYPGEPVPFERLRQRLLSQVQIENDKLAHKDLVQQLKEKGRVKYTAPETTGTSTTNGEGP